MEDIAEDLLDDTGVLETDLEAEAGLCPALLADFSGQDEAVRYLEIALAGCRQRRSVFGHTLLYGPPGLGKTTLARILANELGTQAHVLMAPSIARPAELAMTLVRLRPGNVLFLDEIHALDRRIGEIFYNAIERFRLEIPGNQEDGVPALSLDIAPFTLIGATTRPGRLELPLRDRFDHSVYLKRYDVDGLADIITRSARIMGLQITDDAARIIAEGSRGTPRIANRLLRRVRDFALSENTISVTPDVATRAFSWLGVIENGLDRPSITYLRTLLERFDGGPVGLRSLAAAMGESPDYLEEELEPWLILQGYVDRRRNGRVLGAKGVELLAGLPSDQT